MRLLKRLGVMFAVAAVLAPAPAVAQRRAVDLSFGAGSQTQRVALGSQRGFVVAGGRVRVVGMARVTVYQGARRPFTNRGNVVGLLQRNLDIEPSTFALTLAAGVEARVLPVLAAGFNIDLAGVAAGPTTETGTLTFRPDRPAILKGGSADRGSLNSEFYLSWAARPGLHVRAGLSHVGIAYQVTDEFTAGHPKARYNDFDTVPFVAVSLGR